MLAIITILIMLGVAYVYLGEGLFTAFTMFCGVMAAGLFTFNFWEPIANALGGAVSGTFLAGYEDALVMVFLFAAVLGGFRVIANNFAPFQVEYHALLQSLGGAFFGLLTGYLVTGFLICVLQTLPWKQEFGLGFSPEPGGGLRQVLPPDQVYLAMMYRAGAYAFSNTEGPGTPKESDPYADQYQTFDKYGNFELRYARFRRYDKDGKRRTESGEFAHELAAPQAARR